MKKILLMIALMAATAWGQNINAASLSMPLTPPPLPVVNAYVSVVGTAGTQTYYYWIVANYTEGNAPPSTPFILSGAPNVLSSANYVKISWRPVSGATSYDLLRTSAPTLPATCTCALVIGTTTLQYSDQGSALSSYTVNTLNPSTLGLTLQNQASSAGQAELSAQWGGQKEWSVDSTGAATYNSIISQSVNGVLNVSQYAGNNCGAQTIAALEASNTLPAASLYVPASCGDAPLNDFWLPNALYSVGQVIWDPNGGLEMVTTAGTSASSPPATWPTTVGATTADGSVVWTLQSANIYAGAIQSYILGTSVNPIQNHTFYTPNLGLTLWDNSPVHNVNLLTGQNYSPQISPPDPSMAPILKVIAHETGPSDPVPYYGVLWLNDPAGGVNTAAAAFTDFALPTDEHDGVWGVNEVVGVSNPSFHQQMFGNEVNEDNDTGNDPGSPATGNAALPYWGFAATSYGNAPSTAAFMADSSYSTNEWHVGLFIQQNSVSDAGIQCGSYLSGFNTSADCLLTQSQGAPSYSAGAYYNEPSIPNKYCAGVMTSTTTSANDCLIKQVQPGAPTANPPIYQGLYWNGSTSAAQEEWSNGDFFNTGWLYNSSNENGNFPSALIGSGGVALGWNQQGTKEVDVVDNTDAGTATAYIDWLIQPSSQANPQLQMQLKGIGLNVLHGVYAGNPGGITNQIFAANAGTNQQFLIGPGVAVSSAVALACTNNAVTSLIPCELRGSEVDTEGVLNMDQGASLPPGESLSIAGTMAGTGTFNFTAGTLIAPASFEIGTVQVQNPTISGALALAGTCSSGQYVTGLSNAALPSCAQPSAAGLSNGTTGSGAVVLASSPALTTPSLGAASASSLALNGDAPFSAAPRMFESSFFPGTLTSVWTASTWIPDKAITITRIEAQAKTAPSGCTTNAVLQLSDGTTPVTLTISGAANDSGPLTQNYAAGSSLTVSVSTPAAGCSLSPADVNVEVQYRMQ